MVFGVPGVTHDQAYSSYITCPTNPHHHFTNWNITISRTDTMMRLRCCLCAAVRPAAESQHRVTGVTFHFSLEKVKICLQIHVINPSIPLQCHQALSLSLSFCCKSVMWCKLNCKLIREPTIIITLCIRIFLWRHTHRGKHSKSIMLPKLLYNKHGNGESVKVFWTL